MHVRGIVALSDASFQARRTGASYAIESLKVPTVNWWITCHGGEAAYSVGYNLED